MFGNRVKSVALAGAIGLAPGLASAQSKYGLQPPQSSTAQQVYDLHTLILWICVIIFVGVFSVMLYAIIRHRKSIGHRAAPFHENTTVEIVWTIIPFLVLIGMAYPATKTLLAMRDTSAPEMTIKVTGYQWKWGYDYLQGEGGGIRFYSTLATPRAQIEGRAPKGENYLLEVDHPLVVPVGKKVRILTTAQDVIHAWWVPALGVKQDAYPGFIRDTWFKADKEGTYRGQCAELCGKDHGFMPIVVEVVSAEKYAAWVKEQKRKLAAQAEDAGKAWTLGELKARGEKVYAATCVACHQANGMGLPGAFPALSGSRIVTGAKGAVVNTVLNGVAKDGKPTAMAAFKDQLSDTDVAAVITYARNHWANRTGDMVSPSEVKAARK